MGVLDAFSQSNLSFTKLAEILNNLIGQGGGVQSHNKKVLTEIGLLPEYSYIVSNKEELVYFSKNNKIIENLIPYKKMCSIFLEWSKYLFDISNEELENIQIFNQKIENFKKRTLSKEFFQNNIKKYLFKDKAFNKLLNYGIPKNLRFFIWDIVLNEKYYNKYFNYDEELKEYKLILGKQVPNPQIEKDINRTFMKEIEQTPKNIQILKNILNAINVFDSSGYCQGMNFIVGFLLKLTNYDEVKTFYIFKNILCDIKGYFEDGLPLLKLNNRLFNKNFKELCPKLHKCFQKNDIVNEFWVSKWLQTLFTLSLPFEELTIIWDVLLIRGFDFIVYICLAIIEILEKDLLEIKESSEIISYLERVLNYHGNGLLSTQKKYFEDPNNYINFIIPLNEVLARAYDLEKKSVGGNNNRPYYDRRKSDNQLLNLRFNGLNNINNSGGKNEEKRSSIKSSNSSNNNANNNSNLLNTQQKNVQNPNFQNNININKSYQERKAPFYSSKNLESYNFGKIQQNDIKFNMNINNSIGLNYPQSQFQYYNNNNFPNNMTNKNIIKQFL